MTIILVDYKILRFYGILSVSNTYVKNKVELFSSSLFRPWKRERNIIRINSFIQSLLIHHIGREAKNVTFDSNRRLQFDNLNGKYKINTDTSYKMRIKSLIA